MTPWNAKQMSSYDIRSHVQLELAKWWAARRKVLVPEHQSMNKGGWIWSTTHTCMVQGWLNYYNLEYGMIMAELSHLVGVPLGDFFGNRSWHLDGFLLVKTDGDSASMLVVLKAIRSHFSRDIGLAAARKIWDARVIQSRLEGLSPEAKP